MTERGAAGETAIAAGDAIATNGVDTEGRADGPHASITLRWSRLNKAVVVQENRAGLMRTSIAGPVASDGPSKRAASPTAAAKVILDNVSAYAAPGQVLALMGPSGSGKTTLLNALSGRFALDSGVISVNGAPVTSSGSAMKRFVSQVAYVRQQDIFFNDLSVRDQLAYTAFLRLPQAWTRQEKLDKVDRIIRLLRLSKVQNSPIGMLSGGEKKRVNIGTELLTNPSCLLLDEPTSGLDSTNAVALVRILQNLAARQRKTVILSIHQPSSGLFMSFDRLLMMASGNVVYFGTPQQSIQYLRNLRMACPEGYNLADHWMDLLVVDGTDEIEDADRNNSTCHTKPSPSTSDGGSTSDEENQRNADPSNAPLSDNTRLSSNNVADHPPPELRATADNRQRLIDAWDGEAVSNQIEQQVQNSPKRDSVLASPSDQTAVSKYATSWSTQYCVLTHRAMKNSRTAIFTPLNLMKSTALAVIAGLLWFQLDYTEREVHDRSSFLFFTMTYWVFDGMFNALMAFPPEKAVISKERASSSYHLSAYFLAKTTSEAPTRLTLPLLYMSISFWMAGVSSSFAVFLSSTCISLLSVLSGESFGLLLGASIDRVDRALTTATVLTLSAMLLGGFYVDNVPAFVSWAEYLSPFKYSFDASRLVIFDRDVPCDGSGNLQDICAGGPGTFASRDDLLDFLEVDHSLQFHIIMLFVLIIVPRYGAYLALKHRKGGER